jgi:hypothetical protein
VTDDPLTRARVRAKLEGVILISTGETKDGREKRLLYSPWDQEFRMFIEDALDLSSKNMELAIHWYNET